MLGDIWMNISDIHMGGLYCYPSHNAAVSVFQDAVNDYYSQHVFTIPKGSPFVALEFVRHKREKNFYRLKVLTATGKIGYLVVSSDSPTYIEPVSI